MLIMKVIIPVLIYLFFFISCSNNRESSDTGLSIIEVNDVTTSGKQYEGTFESADDGSSLNIEKLDSLTVKVSIGLFRLTDIEDGVGELPNGHIKFRATDAAGNPIGGTIGIDGDDAILTFTESTWEYIPSGTTFHFVRKSGFCDSL